MIRFWDAEQELKAFDIPTGTDCSVTCMDSTYTNLINEQIGVLPETIEDESDQRNGKSNAECYGPKSGLVVVGCSDGSVRVFDRRCSPNDAKVRTWMEHTACVLQVTLVGDRVISGR